MTAQDGPHTGTDQAIVDQLRDRAGLTTMDQVLAVMQGLDAVLPPTDGVKWFNLLYLLVTRGVAAQPPSSGWSDALWLSHLDVAFAQLYFDALAGWSLSPETVPRAWAALLEARYHGDVQRVQFALAGMNAHINHDLPLAVVQTCAAMQVTPERSSPEYHDFEAVNSILGTVEPEAVRFLATGPEGELAQDLGTLGHVLAMWSVQTARDTAWTNAELLWQLRDLPPARDNLLMVLDRLTGLSGRGLLVPVPT